MLYSKRNEPTENNTSRKVPRLTLLAPILLPFPALRNEFLSAGHMWPLARAYACSDTGSHAPELGQPPHSTDWF